MKVKSKAVIISLIFFLLFQSCKTKQLYLTQSNPFEIKSEIIVDNIFELDSRHIIYPTAFIKTVGKGKLVVKEPISIIGKSQVFDTEINIDFKPFTISEINPEWFGAKGYDQIDDTKAFKKSLQIAKICKNSVNVIVSIGNFYISETLEIGNEVNEIKSINLIGFSMSTSSNYGSSLIWSGKVGSELIKISNLNLSKIENLDFSAQFKNALKYNIVFKPYTNQISIKNCSFAGCENVGSSNINLNIGNGDQVSEISIENCVFRSKTYDNKIWLTDSGIAGGIDNVLNFYVKNCSFVGYQKAAINIHNSSIMVVENCTFGHNDIDINCGLCGLYAVSNFSEHSKAFYKGGVSSNVSFTTLINNYYTGNNKDGYIIRDGAGSLFILNNNFGGTGYNESSNNIKWENQPFNSISSFGNFFKNTPERSNPFFNRSNEPKTTDIITRGDIGGKNSSGRITIEKK